MSFEPGAPAPEGAIPLCVPEIHGREWDYIKECLDTNWVSAVGSFVARFEDMLAAYTGAGHGVATTNGTAALHAALLTAGVEPDDEVLVSGLTFIAPANAIRYVGARPVFIDAEPDYWQMDPEKVVDFIRKECRVVAGRLLNKGSGCRVKAVLPVHILGHPVDMDPIVDVAREFGLSVIEDAAESLGAEYKGRRVGHLGEIGCFSFNGNKLITAGSGGMIVTDNDEWARRAKYLTTQAKDDPVEYVHRAVGYNYRLTNIQAAMGCAQMEKIDEHIAAKRRIAAKYTAAFAGIDGIDTPNEAPWAKSVFWLYTVLVDEARFGLSSRALMRRLAGAGIQTRPLWQPMHRSPAHIGSQSYGTETADYLYQRALSLPCSVGLTEEDMNRVIEAILTAPAASSEA